RAHRLPACRPGADDRRHRRPFLPPARLRRLRRRVVRRSHGFRGVSQPVPRPRRARLGRVGRGDDAASRLGTGPVWRPDCMTDASVVCDLDGVVYRGNTAVPGAKEALLALTEAGVPVLFVTNNSARPPEHVVEKLARVVGFETTPDRVVTSSVVAASLI